LDPQQREHIGDDLRGFVRGDVLFDDLSRGLYSTDASIFQVQPAGVVVPRDEEDVQALVRYAAENGVSLVPRGAGTGLAGESLGPGIVVDLSRHFRGILEVGADTVRVQPGVVYRDLNARLAQAGRRFAPDPASTVCTLGGMLANNASGARALRYGYTRDHVDRLRVVLDTGDAAWVGREPRQPGVEAGLGHLQDIVGAVALLLEDKADLVRSCQPRTPFNRCGYVLHDVLDAETVDLARLLVGSEGTLALFTEAVLKTQPMPGGRAVALLSFPSLESALRGVQRLMPTGPTACELIDRRLLSLARNRDAPFAAQIPAAAEAVLLVEYETDTPHEAQLAGREVVERLYQEDRLALHALSAQQPEEMDRLWQLREAVLPSLYGMRGGAQSVALVEDVAVPTEELAGYVHRVQEVLQEHETTGSFLIHAGTGQVHARPFLDLRKPDDVAKLWLIGEKVHGLALELGGTVSSQHATGLARSPWVARQYGRLYPVFLQLKAVFDPRGIFNPGKIVANGSAPVPRPLRSLPNLEKEPAWELSWREGEVKREVLTCNGCGACRTEAPEQRMCPIFRATHAEAATPRAKANLLREVLQEGAPPVSADEVRAVADLCVNCKMCAIECPARVDIPRLMLEAKAANVAEHGLNYSDWFLSRLDTFAALGSAFSLLVNPLLSSGPVRWLLEKVFGLSRLRRLPRFTGRSFLRRARRHGWTRRPSGDGTRVAYFVDSFANYNDPLIGEAVVAVLRHNGVEVLVPATQRGSGAAPLAHGDVDLARDRATRNLRAFADLAREGYTIVCAEPTAAVMFRQDYLHLIDDPDARIVATHTVELTTFLWQLHQQGRLKTNFRPLDVSLGHHVPCHLKALSQPPAGPGLLSLIPRLRIGTIDVSCSGMAGTYGMKEDTYQTSLAAGAPMLREMRRPRVLFGSTECSACRMQMEEGSGKRTLHPVQYLALAYGLLPEVLRLLEEPPRGWGP
jgi:FAD/FMN-containing dehydrogenase/Fe-S oxidoreductase